MSPATTTATYTLTGLTCAHCVAAVQGELGAIAGVRGVSVDLVAGGTSTVRVESDRPLDRSAVAAAVDEAGYVLADDA